MNDSIRDVRVKGTEHACPLREGPRIQNEKYTEVTTKGNLDEADMEQSYRLQSLFVRFQSDFQCLNTSVIEFFL